MKKLTPVQLMAILICIRVFSMMTYFPFSYSNAFIYMIGALISTCIQAAVVLPAVIFGSVMGKDNPCTLAYSKNRALGVAVTLMYLGFFLFSAFTVVGNFAYFMDYYFTGYVPRFMSVSCCVLAAAYIAHMNVSVLGKTAAFAGAGFLLLTVFVVAGSLSDVHIFNFHLAEESVASSLWQAVKSEFARSGNLVVFAFLVSDLKTKGRSEKSQAGKTAWIYLLLKIAVLELILALITVILGDFALVTKLPFFSLAAFSHTEVIERYDAGFMFIWVIIAIIKLAAYMHCAARCIRIVLPKIPRFTATLSAGILPAAAALGILIPHKWESLAYSEGGSLAIILLTAALPLIMLIYAGKGGFSKGETTAENG